MGPHSHLGPTRAACRQAIRTCELRALQVPSKAPARYREVTARMRQMEVRGMSTEYPHGGGRYLGQWGSVSLIYISRVSPLGIPIGQQAPHTSKSTKKCLYRPGGPSGWGVDGQESCQGHALGVGTSLPHVSWAYPPISSRKGPMGGPTPTPKTGQKRHITAPYSQVDQL